MSFKLNKNIITLTTPVYGYPDWYKPLFYNNALKYFEEDSIHVVRNDGKFDGAWNEKMFYYKFTKMFEHIRNNVHSEFCICIDATDTNFYSSPENIIDKFLSKKCSMLFCAEKGLWPPTSYGHLYENKNVQSEYKYLNAGGWIGYTKEVIRHVENIEKMVTTDMLDDQGRWTTEYLLTEDIKIDSECEIFFSSYLSKKVTKIENGKPAIIGYNPIIVHDNGPYGEDTLKIAELL